MILLKFKDANFKLKREFGLDINILDVSPFGVKRWRKAVSQFEVMLQPVDEKMASLLKPKLNNHLKNPRQVISKPKLKVKATKFLRKCLLPLRGDA